MKVVSSMVTTSIMDPPVRKGGSASSSSGRAQSAPTPVGPSILWPETATASTPSVRTSSGRWGADWQASRTVSAPTARAAATTSATGEIAPVTLETWVKATTRVRSLMAANEAGSRRPSSSTRSHRNVAPVRRASCCHGTRLAWCSASVTTISSPGRRASAVPSRVAFCRAYARRFSASVAFFVQTTSSGRAPRKWARWARPDS